MALRTLVFDLDGTLVDTAPDLVESLNVIFAREGLAPLPYNTVRNFVGGGAKTMIARAIEARGHVASSARLEQIFTDFITYYSDHIADRSRPFPGMTDALDELNNRGYRFAVCTNKLERLSVLLLEQLNLAARFVAICGPDTFGFQKPDPRILRRTIEVAGGTIKDAIMIGDSITDIQTARAADVPIIAVDFGYSEHPVAGLGPNCTISHFAQLPASVAALSPAF
jgi:phosphoglycolate phosphatase